VVYLNVCQNVKTEMFGLKDDTIRESDVGGFIRRAHGDFVFGSALAFSEILTVDSYTV
jgi:hypothetical protein